MNFVISGTFQERERERTRKSNYIIQMVVQPDARLSNTYGGVSVKCDLNFK